MNGKPRGFAGDVDVRLGSSSGIRVEQSGGHQHERHVVPFNWGAATTAHAERHGEALCIGWAESVHVLAAAEPAELRKRVEGITAMGRATSSPAARAMALHPARGPARDRERHVAAQAGPWNRPFGRRAFRHLGRHARHFTGPARHRARELRQLICDRVPHGLRRGEHVTASGVAQLAGQVASRQQESIARRCRRNSPANHTKTALPRSQRGKAGYSICARQPANGSGRCLDERRKRRSVVLATRRTMAVSERARWRIELVANRTA